MKRGRGNVGDARVDDFLEAMQDLASTFDDNGGLFIFLPCLTGQSKNGEELDAKESLPIVLTELITKENSNIVTMFHNDVTLFLNNNATFKSNANKRNYIELGRPMTSLVERKNGWTVLRTTKDGKIKKQVFGVDIQYNKNGLPIEVVPAKEHYLKN